MKIIIKHKRKTLAV